LMFYAQRELAVNIDMQSQCLTRMQSTAATQGVYRHYSTQWH